MTNLLDAYHVLAGQLLEEEETAKIPTAPLLGGRRRLLDSQANDRESQDFEDWTEFCAGVAL